MTTSEEKCNESVLSDKPYHNPNRFKVRKLLQALEDVTKGSPRQNNSVQLMPSRLEYYSPEKMKFLQKDEDPWRYYSNNRQPTKLLHPIPQYSEERFVLEREKVRQQSLERRYEQFDSPTHNLTKAEPYLSPRLKNRIKALEREQLDMRYVPSKFGRIKLDEAVEKFAYWDPNKREQLPKQFTLALPHRITDSHRDQSVNYRKYHSSHNSHSNRMRT